MIMQTEKEQRASKFASFFASQAKKNSELETVEVLPKGWDAILVGMRCWEHRAFSLPRIMC